MELSRNLEKLRYFKDLQRWENVMDFLKHNESLESCSMVALNRLQQVFMEESEPYETPMETTPISQVFSVSAVRFWRRIWHKDPKTSQVQ